MSKTFIDTNILVYCLDNAEKKKKGKCRRLVQNLVEEKCGVISTQVMQEFYVAATKKLDLDPLVAKAILRSFENLETVIITPELIQKAVDASILNTLSLWDALIVCSAENAQCTDVLTEDLNAGQIINGVKIVNPFD